MILYEHGKRIAFPWPPCDAGEPYHPAAVCHHVRLGGGYGQRPSGIAFYYWCREHEPEWEDTDMARHIGGHSVH